jgi:hypothetical protein
VITADIDCLNVQANKANLSGSVTSPPEIVGHGLLLSVTDNADAKLPDGWTIETITSPPPAFCLIAPFQGLTPIERGNIVRDNPQ